MKRESLQKVSGLSNIDPIYDVMGIVDEYFRRTLGDTYIWDEIHQRIPEKKLLDFLFDYLGFPLAGKFKGQDITLNEVGHVMRASKINSVDVSFEQVDSLQEFLKRNGEIYFSDLIEELKKKVKPFDIRCVLMWIFANIGYLRILDICEY